MIKAIVGCRVKDEKYMEPIFLRLKAHAMQYRGFRGMENLVSQENASVVAMLSTWESVADWRAWTQSTIMQELLRQAEAVLLEEPRVTTYRMIPDVTWA